MNRLDFENITLHYFFLLRDRKKKVKIEKIAKKKGAQEIRNKYLKCLGV